MYKDAQIEIELDDILEYISDYASQEDLIDIREALDEMPNSGEINNYGFGCRFDGSYIREEKFILLSRAAEKYTLEELEQKLGNKFDLI